MIAFRSCLISSIHVRCGLPLGRLTFLRYSESASLAGGSGCSLMRWPSSRLCIVVLHYRLCSTIGFEIDILLWKWAPFKNKRPPKWRIQWHGVFGNTFFSENYAPQNLYIESTMMALHRLVSDIW